MKRSLDDWNHAHFCSQFEKELRDIDEDLVGWETKHSNIEHGKPKGFSSYEVSTCFTNREKFNNILKEFIEAKAAYKIRLAKYNEKNEIVEFLAQERPL